MGAAQSTAGVGIPQLTLNAVKATMRKDPACRVSFGSKGHLASPQAGAARPRADAWQADHGGPFQRHGDCSYGWARPDPSLVLDRRLAAQRPDGQPAPTPTGDEARDARMGTVAILAGSATEAECNQWSVQARAPSSSRPR